MKKIIVGNIFLVCALSLSMSVQAKDNLRLFMVKASGVSKKPIKLYRDPTTHSKVIRTIPLKATWLIEKAKPKIYSKVSWQKISWRGKRGWVMSKHIKYDSASSALANKKSCGQKKENTPGCKAL